MIVPKKGGKWQVCVDYTNLNDACPNDSFLLSQIDQIVDATVGHGMLFFIVALSGYHQIPMFQPDEKKTAFMMPHGLYSYKVMSFGLKNADATSKINDKDIQAVDRPNRGSLYWRHCRENQNQRQTRPTPKRNIPPDADVQHEA